MPPVAAQSPSNNANLSSLSVQGTGVAGYSPDTTTYTMNVPGSKAQVTVAAAASHTNANVVISPADADAALDGHQVDLSGGKNVITATVTAEDGATTKDYTVAITRAAVPHDWNLRPPDIETGSEFRVLIVTSTTRSATHGDISVYDAHVRSAVADGGHVDIRDYSQLFKALAGTKDGTTPKGHTGTNPNSDGTGEQIWWLNGPRAANNYADFYDDDGWDHANPARTEAGAAKTFEAYDRPLTVDSDNGVWTGATAGGGRSANEHLGTGRNQARVGIPFSRTTVWSIGGHALKGTQLGLYGLSDVLLVEAPDSPYATVAAITTDPANGSDYRAGETIKATVTFSEAVTVTGTPQLPLRIGDNVRDADYVSGDSSDTVLSFSYPVTADDFDQDGISIDAFVLKLNGDSIKRKDTTVDAALTHTRVAAARGQRVSRPARVQTTLVSNLGQSQFATDAASYDRTQGFTTGQNPGGYNLDTVEIVSVDPQGNDATVSVCTVISAHLPAHYPTSTCTALTPPDSFAAGTLLFTAPAGTILTPSTPYVVVIGSPGGEKLEMSMTDSDDEDDHGEDDWTIAGVYHFELVEGLWINFQDVSLRIAVTGSAGTGDQYALFFSDNTLTRSIAENTAANQNVGAAIPAATDADGDSLTYTMEGVDAASFRFEASTRQIQTSAALDYEAKSSYSVTVTASDGTATATIDVTITVTDEDEPPAAPGTPTLTATAGSTTSLDVSWTEPANEGKPPITSYDLRYRIDSESWTDGPQDETGTTAAISALTAATEYQVQVRASNAEGDSGWSAAGTGSTNTPANNAPEFPSAMATRTVPENLASGQDVGAAIPAATDADAGDTLTYSMEGADAASFTFEASTRQIQTSAALDHEAKPSYSVTVKADDGNGGTDTIAVTITVTDIDEPPDKPAKPTVTATVGSTTSLDVSWTEPGLNGGPEITGYQLQYQSRASATDAWSGVADWTHTGTATTTTITGLTADTEYQVRVQALNGERPSDWSDSSDAVRTNANNAPEFPSAMATRTVPENLASGQDVGAAIPAATDADAGDTLTYSMEGADAASFTFEASTRQIQTSAALDHEAKPSYSVTVKADDGNGGTDTIAVTITVTDIDEPPDKPANPTVTATVGSTTSLDVSWTEPGLNGGPEITGYQLQYQSRASATDAWSGVADWTHTGTATTTTITGLTADTEYQVRVQALNGERPSDWSDSSDAVRTNANNAPEFPSTTATRTVPENTAVNQNVGASIPAATDADGDSLTYTMEGVDAASFTFEASTRQIQTSAALDYEAKPSYSVTVKADDGNGGTDTIAVTITVTDIDEPPDKPANPTVTATVGSTTSLDVSWTEPGLNGGPEITGYQLQYQSRASATDAWSGVADWTHTGTATTTTITGLTADTEYQVRVQALNGERPSDWSEAVRTNANNAPEFPSTTATRTVPERSRREAERLVGLLRRGAHERQQRPGHRRAAGQTRQPDGDGDRGLDHQPG